MSVSSSQRFSRAHPCPICGGYERMPRGKGKRCTGFLSSDGTYAHCTREEYAGALPPENGTEPPSWAHRLEGSCKCGVSHGPGRTAELVERETYPYPDERGRHLFDVVRFEPKTFRIRRADGTWGLGGARLVIFGLDKVRATIEHGDGVVHVVEGERDALRLRAEGLTATTCPMGAGKWREEYTEQLRGATLVVVIADHDDVGIAHAQAIARSLELEGIPHRVLMPPEPGTDVSDLLDDLGELDELVPLLAPELPLDDGAFRPVPVDWAALEAAGVPVVEYLDPEGVHLPKKKRVLAVGPSNSGKSIFAAAKAADASRRGLDVVYVTQENGLEEESRRFLRLGVDPVHLRLYVDQEFDLTLAEHRAALLEACTGVDLVVLDTLSATWFGDEDSNAEIGAFDRDVLKPIVELGATVLVVDHTGNPQPGRKSARRTGVTAPRGASSKGQKADFLLEFEAAGDGTFRVIRGKARGTHGHAPYVFRVVDRDDDTLELVGAPEATIEQTLEDTFADGKWRTSTELAKDAHLRRVDVEKSLEAYHEFVLLTDPKRVGRSANAKVWGTLNMYAGLVFTHPLDDDQVLSGHPGQVSKTGGRTRAASVVPVPKGTGSKEQGQRARVARVRDGTTNKPETFKCKKCGETVETYPGRRGAICRDCARPDLA